MSRLSTINNKVRKAIEARLQKNRTAEYYVAKAQDAERWKEDGYVLPEQTLLITLASSAEKWVEQ